MICNSCQIISYIFTQPEIIGIIKIPLDITNPVLTGGLARSRLASTLRSPPLRPLTR